MEITKQQHDELWETIMDISEGKLMLSEAMHKICVLFDVSGVKRKVCPKYKKECYYTIEMSDECPPNCASL